MSINPLPGVRYEMITKQNLDFSERHLGSSEALQSYALTACLLLTQQTTIERLQGQLPQPSDFDQLAKQILRELYLEILQDLSKGIVLLHNDPTLARKQLNQLHTKISNAINS